MLVYEKHFPLFIEDMKVLTEGSSKRFKQYQAIKKSKLKWTLLKGFMSFLLIFASKIKIKRYISKI